MKEVRKIIFVFVLLNMSFLSLAQSGWQPVTPQLPTRWSSSVSPSNALPEYPRPQLVRNQWQSLNGLWEYAITEKDKPAPPKFEGKILVPYCIESALSGVKKTVQPDQILWYKRKFNNPGNPGNHRILIHFGAVDWRATVWINGKERGTHEGGYGNFTIDITDAVKKGNNEVVVKVCDPTDQGPNPHGKQVLNPKDIWYTPVTGMWQTVWLETVPATYIRNIKLTPDIDQSTLTVHYDLRDNGKNYFIQATSGSIQETVPASAGSVQLKIPDARLWSPNDPYLYDLTVKIILDGKVIDEVKSYFGMRKVEIKKDAQGHDRIFLNNQYVYNLGVLDQGFWPDGIYTAPTDEALAFDIKAIKAMGFNTIRKHIKREPDRWYYHCDKLGMIVWQDMVNPSFNLTAKAGRAFESESKESIEQLYNHPCITTWTLFNEKWGQYDQERLTKWIKQLDPTRLVNGHSGEFLYVNEKLRSPSPDAYIESDMTDVHSYPDPMNAFRMDGKARVLGEFGGIGVFIPDHQWNTKSAWGYINVTPSQLLGKYTIMNQHLKLLEKEGLSASIYTQPFDVEVEQNGLMTYDREVIKIPFDELRKIHSLLVPTANNLPEVEAKNADLTDPGTRYSRLFQEYVEGKREISFLRKSAMMAQQVGDKAGLARITSDYFTALKKPYTPEDIQFIYQIAAKTSDPAFIILKDNATEFDKELGKRRAENKIMTIIYGDHIESSVTGQNPHPDWDELSDNVARYGSLGDEILIRAKTIHYLNQHDWENFAESAAQYVGKYGTNIKPEELNNYARTVFDRINSQELLLKAAVWSKLSISKKEDAAFLDTYANLLYKAGKKDQAIALQQKAVELSDESDAFKETLSKMKQGVATWQ